MNAHPFIRSTESIAIRETAEYEARNAGRLVETRMLADARRPLRDKPAHELQEQKTDIDERMKQIAAAEQRLWKAMEEMAGSAILSLPEHLRPFFEVGQVVDCILRTASAQKVQSTQEALAYEIDERRMDAEDAA